MRSIEAAYEYVIQDSVIPSILGCGIPLLTKSIYISSVIIVKLQDIKSLNLLDLHISASISRSLHT